MRNSTSYFTFLILGVFLLPGVHAIGQVKQTPESRQELLRKVLEEKGFNLPGQLTGRNDEVRERMAGKTTATDQRVSANPNTIGEGEISVIYDPTDSNNLLLSFMQQNSSGALTFPVYYSSNGGASWSLSNFNSTGILSADFPGQFAAGGGDPAFAWDKNGKVYYAWIYLTVKPSFDTAFFTLNWAYSTNKGHTWSVASKHFIGRGALNAMTQDPFIYKDGITDREWLAVDNSGGPHQGNVYCSFVDFPGDVSLPSAEAIKVLIPGIDTFGNMVSAYVGGTQFGNVEVDNAGVLHMSLADIDNSCVRHVASADGGVSFGTSSVVAYTGTMFPNPPFVVQNRENAAINMAINGPSGTGSNVHIVWSDFPGGTVNSYYSHSTDGGVTWSATDTINKLLGGKITIMPTVAAYGNNVAISVAAVDTADSARYYVINSTDNGNTFYSPQLVSSVPTNYKYIGAADTNSSMFFGDYNRSVRTQCVVYSTWSDGRNNAGPKVYFSRVNYCTLGIKEITSVNDNVQVLSLFPNPATDKVTVKVNASKSEPVTVQITDINGRVLTTQHYLLTNGEQNITVALNGMAKGAYVLSVQDNNGLIATRSLVVQ